MSSFKLTIKKPDGSHYWTEHFNEMVDLDRWLTEEKTRPYWDKGFIYEVVAPARGIVPDNLKESKELIKYMDYCQGRNEMNNKMPALVKTTGGYKIQTIDIGERPSNMVMVLPAGWNPGDEQFISEKNGQPVLDWDSKAKAFDQVYGTTDKAIKAEDWNQQGALSRMKKSFFGV